MNRPPKKKKQHKEDLAEDPRFSREELAAAGHAPAADGDDRNLVEIDDAFAEADFEDRMWLYWQKNKVGIVAVIIIAILGVVGINTWKMMQDNKVVAIQEEYTASIGDTAKLQAFGTENSGAILGGLALLEVADKKYEEGDYAAATNLYTQSLPGLKDSVVVYRARLGQGMAQIKAGQVDAGKATLKSLAEGTGVLNAIRAEAAVELAQLELAAGNSEAAGKLLVQVEGMKNAEYWKARATALMRMEKIGSAASES